MQINKNLMQENLHKERLNVVFLYVFISSISVFWLFVVFTLCKGHCNYPLKFVDSLF